MPVLPTSGPRAIMFQGTGTDVGKSLIVCGLARAWTRRGLRVRPFKPQNMSNNAAVTEDGGEIGRAQALQARACRIPPGIHMNPVLLKPQAESGAQVIVQGRVFGTADARGFYRLKPELLPKVRESFRILSNEADLVIVEGAGSPAEVNLRDGDIANMGFATAAGVPVVLIADIDKGGVIASLVGTHQLLEPAERRLLTGFIINKFRGDKSLFDSGIEIITNRTDLGCYGVVPWFDGAHRLPAEDVMGLPAPSATDGRARIRIAVPRLARIANFDDLDPLKLETDVDVAIIQPGYPIPPNADIVLLTGSKSTRSDLEQLRREGWDIDILAHVRRGGFVVGLCAGFQMLGRTVDDPEGIEGPAGSTAGLALLDVATRIAPAKALLQVKGVHPATGAPVRGYEMHMGQTEGAGLSRPMLQLDARPDGAVSADGRIMGCYVHGLFTDDTFRQRFLAGFRDGALGRTAYEADLEQTLDALAEHLEANLDLDALLDSAAPVQTVGT